jgi:ParB family chromosome partitioning protein
MVIVLPIIPRKPYIHVPLFKSYAGGVWMSVENIPVERIKPLFPRSVSDEGLEELATSIKSGAILQHPIVRESRSRKGYYELIAGYRRYLAARRAGFPIIPCIIIECDDAEAFKINLIENIQRENLTDYEVAKRISEFRKLTGYSTTQIALLLGKSQAWVENHLRMLRLEEAISREITPPSKVMEKVPEYTARIILQQPEEIQEKIIKEVVKTIEEEGEPPSARKLERTIKEIVKPKEEPEEKREHGERVVLKTPEEVDRFFEQLAKPSVEETACPRCGCKLKINWSERKIEWDA